MTTQTPKVTLETLKQLIAEEIEKVNEQVDHKTINGIVSVASKLLAAVETFREKAPPAAINATTPHLGELEKVLENMLSSPGSYVPTPKKEPKKVSLSSKSTKEGRLREAAGRSPIDMRTLQAQFPDAFKGLLRAAKASSVEQLEATAASERISFYLDEQGRLHWYQPDGGPLGHPQDLVWQPEERAFR